MEQLCKSHPDLLPTGPQTLGGSDPPGEVRGLSKEVLEGQKDLAVGGSTEAPGPRTLRCGWSLKGSLPQNLEVPCSRQP